MLASGDGYQPPDAPLSRGLEVHPSGERRGPRRSGSTASYVPAGYGWSFPARDELRIGIGSFDPRFHVKDTTVQLTEDLGKEPNEYQGNWIPHKLRRATEGGVFFAGDSAGHCLPLSAEGIRTALYFGIALGRELRGVVEGRQSREQAAATYAAFHDSHEWKFSWMLRVQKLIPRVPPRMLGAGDPADGREALRRLVLRALPADRAAGVRRGSPAQRTTRTVPASSRTTPRTRSGLSGTWSRPNRPRRSITTEAVSWPKTVAAATPPAPIARDRDQRVEDVEGAEEAAEQVVPADVEGRAEAAGLAAEDDDRGQRQGADREGDQRRGHAAGRLAEAGVDRRLGGDQPARGGGEEDGEAPIHGLLPDFA